VVLGGSIAGLLAARVLADSYDSVTVVDRDSFPPIGDHRRGVPQGRHAHGLLARGREILEELFPGLTDELVARGALAGSLTDQARWLHEGRYQVRYASDLVGLAVSRPLLEGFVRERLFAMPNVTAMEQTDAVGLMASASGDAVTGVRVTRAEAQGVEEVVPCDLLVDATGRASHAPAWLESLGYPRPVEEQVRVDVAYTTRTYRRIPTDIGGDRAIIVAASPSCPRGAALLAQENDRWLLTLIAYHGDAAPPDDAGFADFAASLPTDDIYQLVKHAEPLGGFLTARFPASRRLRYEALTRFPERFVVVGDAISSFNPIYGQGMTVAASEALALGAELAGGAQRLGPRFFRRASQLVDGAWSIAVGNDLRLPATVGHRTAMVRFINWYVAKLLRVSHRDPAVALAFQRVANLLAPPPSLLGPAVALRVVRGSLLPR
jgi:2-polyprenyl-6-methoxyphenol hydroxylase-like FAD-dependent oxidoreductase